MEPSRDAVKSHLLEIQPVETTVKPNPGAIDRRLDGGRLRLTHDVSFGLTSREASRVPK